jgi:DNA-binding CsgD family transcriptional regulator
MQYGVCRRVDEVHSVSERDAAALLEVVSELDGLDDPLAFPPKFLALLGGLMGVREVSYCVLDRRNARGVSASGWSDGEEFVEMGHGPSDDQYMRLRHSHPLCSYRERTGDWTTVHTVSDFATQSQFRRTAVWNDVYRREGVNYWLDMGLPVEHGTTRVFIFTHASRDFGPRERLLIALLAPHLERRAAAVRTAGQAVEALTAVEEASDEARDVVLATAHGTIEFASPRARALLSHYFGMTNGTLPARLLGGGTVVVRGGSGRLTVRVARVDGLLVLLLGEDDGRVEALTPRQRDVLAGVAAGLTDVQVGERLGVAPATVGKHLETIYERLGVHTRTAAAAVYRH